MLGWHERYLNGFHQEVYDELLSMQDHIGDTDMYEEALAVAHTIMRRLQYNIQLLLPRLHSIRYHFGEGFWESSEEQRYWEQHAPPYKAPDPQTVEHVATLEQLAGPLPFSLQSFYEEVGSVNFVGTFPISKKQRDRIAYGSDLDPLFVYSVEMVLTMNEGNWSDINHVSIAPDRYFKYGYSGSGQYTIQTPCTAFDAPLEGYDVQESTFVNYLRRCLRWGGFPGLERENRLPPEALTFLTKDLLPF